MHQRDQPQFPRPNGPPRVAGVPRVAVHCRRQRPHRPHHRPARTPELMKLYLLRHATAVDIASSDALRELTKEGREEARIAGAALAELGVKLSHFFSSPLVRARQTAEIAAKALKFPGKVEILDELENGSSTT